MTQELFDRATREATCNFLSSSGQGATAYAAWGLLTPGPFDEFGAVAYAGLAKVAYDLGCTWDPDAPDSNPISPVSGCSEITGGVGQLGYTQASFGAFNPFQSVASQNCVKIVATNLVSQTGTNQLWEVSYLQKDKNTPDYQQWASDTTDPVTVSIQPTGDAQCASQETPGDEYSYNYSDPDTGCSLNVALQGYAVDPANRVSPVWQITQSADGLRANGGVISGDCNFAPTVVVPGFNGPGGGGGGYGGGGGGPTYLPLPDNPVPGPQNAPWWQEALRELAAGVVGELVAEALKELLEQPFAGTTYRMVSVCEKDASGEPISEAVEVPIPELKAPDAQLARLDAIVELLQASKNFKQPVCPDERPTLEGDWRTISFRSQESSPYGKSCLRKRFRYRSLSGIGLGELVDHWKDFTWQSGPVIVTHEGYSWGSPKVWAVTADEGKRVIQHAAGEAGFDANQVGKWRISNCASSRYGVSLPMKVDTKGGYYWVTARDGEDGRPIVALQHDS